MSRKEITFSVTEIVTCLSPKLVALTKSQILIRKKLLKISGNLDDSHIPSFIKRDEGKFVI